MTALEKLVENKGELESAQKMFLKTESRVKRLEIKLQAEINANELNGKRLQEMEKNLPCNEPLAECDLLWNFYGGSSTVFQKLGSVDSPQQSKRHRNC